MTIFSREALSTPAQRSSRGNMNFVTDVPVQGPTDEGMRAASCWWAQNRLNDRCVDCTGIIPAWTRVSLRPGGPAGPNSGIGDNMEAISFGGVGTPGFALAAAGDPDIWNQLSGEQKTWLANVKEKLNALIIRETGTECKTWGPGATYAGSNKCFQNWYNSYGLNQLRTDGVLDLDTLKAFIELADLHWKDFPRFPGTVPGAITPAPTPAAAEEKKGLSTGATAGLALGGAVIIGGIAYVATRKGGKSRRRR